MVKQQQVLKPAGPAAQKPPAQSAPAPTPVPPLFRGIDWLTMAITFAVIWSIYVVMLAPELTLEDSGELVTGALYAGIPHPPGYPVWTLYSWLWTELLHTGSMAWRVAAGQATASALACGLIAIMVSRGSSMLMEGIEELKGITGKWENAICLISGLVAGLLVGLDGFMWSESVVVNRVAVFSVPWLMMVLVCLLRWIYAPHQLRYVYWALFLYGMCITTHQSLLTASLGIEVAIAAGNKRLGRDVFLGNGVIYILYNLIVLATGHQIFQNLATKPGLNFLFHAVGIGSLVASGWLAVKTKGLLSEWKPVVIMGLLWILGVSFYFYMPIAGMTNPPMQWGYPRTVTGFFEALSRGQYEQPNPSNVVADPFRFLGQVWLMITGTAEEFSWVYIFIALVPFVFFFKMQQRERAWIIGLTAIYFFVGVFLLILINPAPDIASADLIKVFLISSHTMVAALIGYGLALTAAFMATHYERFRPWGLLGGAVAAVLALYCLWDTTGTHYFGPAGQVSLSSMPRWIAQAFKPHQYGLPIFANLILIGLALVFILALLAYRRRAPLLITLALFAVMPLYPGLSHWFNSEQRGHMFGYWFGHDMFTPPFKGADGKPLYPVIAKDAVLYGGTDPGRFCPTYIVFSESFTPHDCQPAEDQKFDRRDVYVITQNALANGQYLCYLRAQYNKSQQIQYDTPFFSELARFALHDRDYQTNFIARMVSPLDTFFTAVGDRVEKRRRTYTSWFQPDHFTDLSGLIARLRPGDKQDPLSRYLFDNLGRDTQSLITTGGDPARVKQALADDLNALLERELKVHKSLTEARQKKDEIDGQIAAGDSSESLRQKQTDLGREIAGLSQTGPLYETNRFAGVRLSKYLLDFIAENPQSYTRIRLNRLLLEAAYPNQIASSLGGVYPDREIYIASPSDLQSSFDEYYKDVQRRLIHDRDFKNEPPLIKPGEGVSMVAEGGQERIQISGQVAIFGINAAVAKVIFDHCPDNEFYVEESFPLDWMFPHLTPYGIIMKVNRNALPEITDEICQRDHEFWKQFSKRLSGDSIDYNTSVKDVADWIEKTYLRHDFTGYTGDLKFIRDRDGQKAFSKLRGSIGGIYAWRAGLLAGTPTPAQYMPKTPAEQQRMLREADFAYKQSFAYCPYSPELLFRYVNVLSALNRLDDALIVAQTCLKLDPNNGVVIDLANHLDQALKLQSTLNKK